MLVQKALANSVFSPKTVLKNRLVLWFCWLVEVKSGRDGFIIKMRDGKHLRCVHNNPNGGHLPDYSPHPAIVLKMEDETGLLLPIIVCMHFSRPIYYHRSLFLGFYFDNHVFTIVNFWIVCSGDAKRITNGSNTQCSNSMSFYQLIFIMLPSYVSEDFRLIKKSIDRKILVLCNVATWVLTTSRLVAVPG